MNCSKIKIANLGILVEDQIEKRLVRLNMVYSSTIDSLKDVPNNFPTNLAPS
jgi:hypothetical protein